MASWLLALGSVLAVSLASLVGVLTLFVRGETLRKALLYMVSFSAGGLFGDAFLHLMPEAMAEPSFAPKAGFVVIFGVLSMFTVERFLQWRHSHEPVSKEHAQPFAVMNLLGDAVHNVIDGLVIGGSYIASVPLGVATTLAVLFHEIPQELGDFGVLVYGGLSNRRALVWNLLTALTAVLGTLVALIVGSSLEDFTGIVVPFAAGNFIYIAGSDLLPEIRTHEPEPGKAALQLVCLVMGVLVMLSLTMVE